MKKFITNILIIIAVGCAGALVAWCVTHDEQTELFSEQETTLRTFFSALSQGDWATAGSVCDSTKMTGYIDNYREAWNSAKAKDTSLKTVSKASSSPTAYCTCQIFPVEVSSFRKVHIFSVLYNS